MHLEIHVVAVHIILSLLPSGDHGVTDGDLALISVVAFLI